MSLRGLDLPHSFKPKLVPFKDYSLKNKIEIILFIRYKLPIIKTRDTPYSIGNTVNSSEQLYVVADGSWIYLVISL